MVLDHLKGRRCYPHLYKGITITEEATTFPLWNLSGQLVGFQQYTPKAPKRPKKPLEGKYWTIFNSKKCQTAFGVDLLDNSQKTLYVVEGVFDATPLHAMGLNCVAVLTNNPKHLREWLSSLGYNTIALCEGDKAGRMLATVTNASILLPEGKDVGDLSNKQINEIIR